MSARRTKKATPPADDLLPDMDERRRLALEVAFETEELAFALLNHWPRGEECDSVTRVLANRLAELAGIAMSALSDAGDDVAAIRSRLEAA